MILLATPREEKPIYRYTKYQFPDHISIKRYLVYTLFFIVALYICLKLNITSKLYV